uniref:Selectin P ligand n=1 Tax=Astyanax mexicanus TaxID=7994 RepID=A0A8B9HEH6_ASTMX
MLQMMVMTNRPELRPPLLLLIMSGLVISNNLTSTEISQSQSMTTSRSVQEHSTAVPPSSHVTEKTASTAAKPASTNPPSSQSSQTPGKTTTTSTTTTTTSGGNRGHICPTKEAHKKEPIVGLCLIAIAVLAGLAIIFIFSTIILATKLASSRYRNRMHLLQDTEMVCISALMNDTEHPIPKPRHPKSNGALIPNMEDEDGDALTLNSFLPDTECPALN